MIWGCWRSPTFPVCRYVWSRSPGSRCPRLRAGITLLLSLQAFLYWNRFSVGMAPLVIGVFFFVSIQLVSIGILGRVYGSVLAQVQHRPYVIERERVNWEYEPGEPLSPQSTAVSGVSDQLNAGDADRSH